MLNFILIALIIASISLLFFVYTKYLFFKALYKEAKVQEEVNSKRISELLDIVDIYDIETERSLDKLDFLKIELANAKLAMGELRNKNSVLELELKKSSMFVEKLQKRVKHVF